MTKNSSDASHMTVVRARLLRWGAGVAALGLGAALTAGAMPATPQPFNVPAPVAAGFSGAALPVTGLDAQTVGVHAKVPATQDNAALPRHDTNRVTVDVTAFGADPTGRTDSAKAVNDAILYAKSLHRPTTISFPCGT